MSTVQLVVAYKTSSLLAAAHHHISGPGADVVVAAFITAAVTAVLIFSWARVGSAHYTHNTQH